MVSTNQSTLELLLRYDLNHTAHLVGFNPKPESIFTIEFVRQCISELDGLSHSTVDVNRRRVVIISALLWTYAQSEYPGLKDFLILYLSRIGFGPSTIILDQEYDSQNNSYTGIDSIVNQYAITLNQIREEVSIQGKTFLLTSFQKQIWDQLEINPLIGISAPTSAGKSFIILLKAMDLLLKSPGKIVYVVPTLSLVSQVTGDFRKFLKLFGLDDYEIETTYNVDNVSIKKVYVLTQERAISSFSQSEHPFDHIRLLIIDEIQNVERVADWEDQRAKILYDLMIELRNSSKIDHILLAGPRINNLGVIGKEIFGIDAYTYKTDSSPVVSVTYTILKREDQYYLKLFNELLEKPLEVQIQNSGSIKGYGSAKYTPEYLTFLAGILSSLNSDEANIIFAPTTIACRTIAISLAKDASNLDNNYLNGLSDFISSSIHPKFTLASTIKKGVAYHHGKLPHHLRIILEHGIRKGQIKDVICTTTLLQGVNLPVQNIIIRNPNLFTIKSKGAPKLTNYEIANLRGRAGRLLKDFIGKTYIMDETSFNDTQKDTTLLNTEGLNLKTGYGEKFGEYRDRILTDLADGVGHTNDNKQYSYLTTYIRQTILKQGERSRPYLDQVGIKVSDAEVRATKFQLDSLLLDSQICSANRYWDPFDLAKLYRESGALHLPTSAAEKDISKNLKEIVIFFKNNLPTYYERYFPIIESKDKDIIWQKCIQAENWLREKPLNEILNDSYFNTAEKIEDAVKFLQERISYGLPMLLRPLYNFRVPNSSFPLFVEMGAHKPEIRKLIELNLSRETSIYLNKRYDFKNKTSAECLGMLRAIYQEPLVSYWHKIQIEGII